MRASLSRTFRKPKNAEEGKKLIENATRRRVHKSGKRHSSRLLYINVCGIQRFLEDTNGTDASLHTNGQG